MLAMGFIQAMPKSQMNEQVSLMSLPLGTTGSALFYCLNIFHFSFAVLSLVGNFIIMLAIEGTIHPIYFSSV